MRRTIKAAIAALALAVGLLAANVQPAGATIWQNQAWHGGRAMYDNYGAGPVCTSGPTFYSGLQGRYYKAMPRHCFETTGWNNVWAAGSPFAGIFEGDPSNLHDNNCCWKPQAGTAYERYDVVLVDLGTSAPAKSKLVFNYCNGANCSSYYGGGSANANWAGSWFTIVGYINSGGTGVAALTKSGMRSGTSWTTSSATGPTTASYNGYSTPVYTAPNLGQCGSSYGDSGAPVYYNSGAGVYLMGMLISGNNVNTAAPGNGCYATGSAFGTNMKFIDVATIKAAFAYLDPASLAPYF